MRVARNFKQNAIAVQRSMVCQSHARLAAGSEELSLIDSTYKTGN